MNTNQSNDPKIPTTMFNFMSPTTTTQQATSPAPSMTTLSSGSLTGAAFKPPTTVQSKSSLGTTGFNITPSTQASTLTPTPIFGMPATTKPATTNPGIPLTGLKPTAAAVSQPATTPSTTSAPAATTSAVAPSLGLSAATSTAAATPALGGSSLVLGAKTPVPPAASQPQALNFQQLEELILNKWTAELYEQEKLFYNQATQINIWDKVINENAEKLTQLHSTMEKVRKQQTKINDDLEVIATHQRDLENCLIPLEKEDLLSVLKGDPNRKNLYSNAKKIDSQIKSMSENLKETIEHINETSRSHDTEDPVIQVGRILNAHMESLRWIDEHTARMQDYFDSLLKIHDDLRRECDLSKH